MVLQWQRDLGRYIFCTDRTDQDYLNMETPLGGYFIRCCVTLRLPCNTRSINTAVCWLLEVLKLS